MVLVGRQGVWAFLATSWLSSHHPMRNTMMRSMGRKRRRMMVMVMVMVMVKMKMDLRM